MKFKIIVAMVMFYFFHGVALCAELSIDIEVNRHKENNRDWDNISSPPPDVFGSLQIEGKQYEIPLKMDTYIYPFTLTVDSLKINDRITIQVYDRDRIRKDDVIVIDTLVYTGKKEEVLVKEFAKIKFIFEK